MVEETHLPAEAGFFYLSAVGRIAANKQFIPCDVECGPQAQNRAKARRNFSGFNLLQVANVDINLFSQPYRARPNSLAGSSPMPKWMLPMMCGQ